MSLILVIIVSWAVQTFSTSFMQLTFTSSFTRDSSFHLYCKYTKAPETKGGWLGVV